MKVATALKPLVRQAGKVNGRPCSAALSEHPVTCEGGGAATSQYSVRTAQSAWYSVQHRVLQCFIFSRVTI